MSKKDSIKQFRKDMSSYRDDLLSLLEKANHFYQSRQFNQLIDLLRTPLTVSLQHIKGFKSRATNLELDITSPLKHTHQVQYGVKTTSSESSSVFTVLFEQDLNRLTHLYEDTKRLLAFENYQQKLKKTILDANSLIEEKDYDKAIILLQKADDKSKLIYYRKRKSQKDIILNINLVESVSQEIESRFTYQVFLPIDGPETQIELLSAKQTTDTTNILFGGKDFHEDKNHVTLHQIAKAQCREAELTRLLQLTRIKQKEKKRREEIKSFKDTDEIKKILDKKITKVASFYVNMGIALDASKECTFKEVVAAFNQCLTHHNKKTLKLIEGKHFYEAALENNLAKGVWFTLNSLCNYVGIEYDALLECGSLYSYNFNLAIYDQMKDTIENELQYQDNINTITARFLSAPELHEALFSKTQKIEMALERLKKKEQHLTGKAQEEIQSLIGKIERPLNTWMKHLQTLPEIGLLRDDELKKLFKAQDDCLKECALAIRRWKRRAPSKARGVTSVFSDFIRWGVRQLDVLNWAPDFKEAQYNLFYPDTTNTADMVNDLGKKIRQLSRLTVKTHAPQKQFVLSKNLNLCIDELDELKMQAEELFQRKQYDSLCALLEKNIAYINNQEDERIPYIKEAQEALSELYQKAKEGIEEEKLVKKEPIIPVEETNILSPKTKLIKKAEIKNKVLERPSLIPKSIPTVTFKPKSTKEAQLRHDMRAYAKKLEGLIEEAKHLYESKQYKEVIERLKEPLEIYRKEIEVFDERAYELGIKIDSVIKAKHEKLDTNQNSSVLGKLFGNKQKELTRLYTGAAREEEALKHKKEALELLKCFEKDVAELNKNLEQAKELIEKEDYENAKVLLQEIEEQVFVSSKTEETYSVSLVHLSHNIVATQRQYTIVFPKQKGREKNELIVTQNQGIKHIVYGTGDLNEDSNRLALQLIYESYCQCAEIKQLLGKISIKKDSCKETISTNEDSIETKKLLERKTTDDELQIIIDGLMQGTKIKDIFNNFLGKDVTFLDVVDACTQGLAYYNKRIQQLINDKDFYLTSFEINHANNINYVLGDFCNRIDVSYYNIRQIPAINAFSINLFDLKTMEETIYNELSYVSEIKKRKYEFLTALEVKQERLGIIQHIKAALDNFKQKEKQLPVEMQEKMQQLIEYLFQQLNVWKKTVDTLPELGLLERWRISFLSSGFMGYMNRSCEEKIWSVITSLPPDQTATRDALYSLIKNISQVLRPDFVQKLSLKTNGALPEDESSCVEALAQIKKRAKALFERKAFKACCTLLEKDMGDMFAGDKRLKLIQEAQEELKAMYVTAKSLSALQAYEQRQDERFKQADDLMRRGKNNEAWSLFNDISREAPAYKPRLFKDKEKGAISFVWEEKQYTVDIDLRWSTGAAEFITDLNDYVLSIYSRAQYRQLEADKRGGEVIKLQQFEKETIKMLKEPSNDTPPSFGSNKLIGSSLWKEYYPQIIGLEGSQNYTLKELTEALLETIIATNKKTREHIDKQEYYLARHESLKLHSLESMLKFFIDKQQSNELFKGCISPEIHSSIFKLRYLYGLVWSELECREAFKKISWRYVPLDAIIKELIQASNKTQNTLKDVKELRAKLFPIKLIDKKHVKMADVLDQLIKNIERQLNDFNQSIEKQKLCSDTETFLKQIYWWTFIDPVATCMHSIHKAIPLLKQHNNWQPEYTQLIERIGNELNIYDTKTPQYISDVLIEEIEETEEIEPIKQIEAVPRLPNKNVEKKEKKFQSKEERQFWYDMRAYAQELEAIREKAHSLYEKKQFKEVMILLKTQLEAYRNKIELLDERGDELLIDITGCMTTTFDDGYGMDKRVMQSKSVLELFFGGTEKKLASLYDATAHYQAFKEHEEAQEKRMQQAKKLLNLKEYDKASVLLQKVKDNECTSLHRRYQALNSITILLPDREGEQTRELIAIQIRNAKNVMCLKETDVTFDEARNRYNQSIIYKKLLREEDVRWMSESIEISKKQPKPYTYVVYDDTIEKTLSQVIELKTMNDYDKGLRFKHILNGLSAAPTLKELIVAFHQAILRGNKQTQDYINARDFNSAYWERRCVDTIIDDLNCMCKDALIDFKDFLKFQALKMSINQSDEQRDVIDNELTHQQSVNKIKMLCSTTQDTKKPLECFLAETRQALALIKKTMPFMHIKANNSKRASIQFVATTPQTLQEQYEHANDSMIFFTLKMEQELDIFSQAVMGIDEHNFWSEKQMGKLLDAQHTFMKNCKKHIFIAKVRLESAPNLDNWFYLIVTTLDIVHWFPDYLFHQQKKNAAALLDEFSATLDILMRNKERLKQKEEVEIEPETILTYMPVNDESLRELKKQARQLYDSKQFEALCKLLAEPLHNNILQQKDGYDELNKWYAEGMRFKELLEHEKEQDKRMEHAKRCMRLKQYDEASLHLKEIDEQSLGQSRICYPTSYNLDITLYAKEKVGDGFFGKCKVRLKFDTQGTYCEQVANFISATDPNLISDINDYTLRLWYESDLRRQESYRMKDNIAAWAQFQQARLTIKLEPVCHNKLIKEQAFTAITYEKKYIKKETQQLLDAIGENPTPAQLIASFSELIASSNKKIKTWFDAKEFYLAEAEAIRVKAIRGDLGWSIYAETLSKKTIALDLALSQELRLGMAQFDYLYQCVNNQVYYDSKIQGKKWEFSTSKAIIKYFSDVVIKAQKGIQRLKDKQHQLSLATSSSEEYIKATSAFDNLIKTLETEVTKYNDIITKQKTLEYRDIVKDNLIRMHQYLLPRCKCAINDAMPALQAYIGWDSKASEAVHNIGNILDIYHTPDSSALEEIIALKEIKTEEPDKEVVCSKLFVPKTKTPKVKVLPKVQSKEEQQFRKDLRIYAQNLEQLLEKAQGFYEKKKYESVVTLLKAPLEAYVKKEEAFIIRGKALKIDIEATIKTTLDVGYGKVAETTESKSPLERLLKNTQKQLEAAYQKCEEHQNKNNKQGLFDKNAQKKQEHLESNDTHSDGLSNK
jgi:flagellar assembly factor FliW